MIAKPNGSAVTHADRGASSMIDSDTLLAIEDVAEILKVPTSWVYDRTRRRSHDRIPGFRLGKYWRFRRSEVLRWLEQQRIGTKPNA